MPRQPALQRGKSEPEYVWVIVRIDGPFIAERDELRAKVKELTGA